MCVCLFRQGGILRKERDSNPRTCYSLRFSRPMQSTNSAIFPSSPPWDSKWVDISVFYFLKTCWSYPLKTSNTTGRDCVSPFIPRCPTRAVDILRNHSLGLDSKTVEYLLLIIVINPLIDVLGHYHHLFFLKKCFLPWLSPMYSII